MIELKDLEIGKKVYWSYSYGNEVENGPINEIHITKQRIVCKIDGDSYENIMLYTTFSDAEIDLVDRLMWDIKGKIHDKAKELKNLRERKSDALALKLGQIDTE